jgi:hypothetical protein
MKNILITFFLSLFFFGCSNSKDFWLCYGHKSQNFAGMNYLSILEINFKKNILKNYWGFTPPDYKKYPTNEGIQFETPTNEQFIDMKNINKFNSFLIKKYNEDELYVRFDIIDKDENKIRYVIHKEDNTLYNDKKGKLDDENHDFGGLTKEEEYRVARYRCSNNRNFKPF